MAREFIVPGEIISGSGALDMAEGALKLLGKKALIVTDKVMIDLGNCAKVEKALTNQGIESIAPTTTGPASAHTTRTARRQRRWATAATDWTASTSKRQAAVSGERFIPRRWITPSLRTALTTTCSLPVSRR